MKNSIEPVVYILHRTSGALMDVVHHKMDGSIEI